MLSPLSHDTTDEPSARRTGTSEHARHLVEQLFPGDSELAARMRRFDWNASPVGPPELWPENLRTALGICLMSRFPMHVWWGEALTLFYNDAYVSFLGRGKHPDALGRSGREVWAEIWDTIGPMIDGVLSTRRASWSEDILMFFDRAVRREEVYVTFSFSPILGPRGSVDGLFCACTETTEKLIGNRRLETLRRLGVRAAQAQDVSAACRTSAEVLAQNPHDLPFAAIYLADEDRRTARLAASVRLPRRSALPASVSVGHADRWQLAAVLRDRRPAELDLRRMRARLPGGPWPESAARALVLPIPSSAHDDPAGLLIAGLSPRRAVDDRYRSFLSLVAGHIGTAIADARAYELERQRAEALAELDRAKTLFFNNVSHELRTPLTLILGPTEDALASPARALEGESLEAAHRNARRLLKLVNTLLDFSRIEAGKTVASFEPVALDVVTADLAALFRSAFERAGVDFLVRCESIPAPIYVDVAMWEKIVLNLLSNALKFTFEGEVEVTVRPAVEGAILSVRDTGVGVSRDELPRMFERFHRIEGARSRTHEGSGIGLALVRELVRMHGGNVTAESELGKGTTFTVTLPAGTAHLPADQLRAARPHEGPGKCAGVFVEEALRWLPADESRGATPSSVSATPESPDEIGDACILVADDNADMREYLARLLEKRWFVKTVGDGAAALAAARQLPFDLVLTDVMMPGLDGVGLVKAFRADPDLADTPVVLLTARAGEISRIEGLETGADDYLVKPFSARELLARVETHLRRSRQRSLAAENAALVQLHELSVDLLSGRALPDLLQAAVDAAVSLARADQGDIQLYDRDKDALELAVHRGLAPPLLAHLGRVKGGAADARAEAVRLRRRVIVSNVGSDRACLGRSEKARLEDAGVGAVQSTPILARSGTVLGVLTTHWRSSSHPGGRTLRMLDLLARQVADLIEHRRNEEALHRTETALREADRRKDEFISMLSHELRNPLFPIMTAVQLLKLHKGEERAGEIDLIERASRHMSRLVDDLLDVSRITQGRIQLDLRPVPIRSVIARGIELAAPLIEQRGHHLSVRGLESSLRVLGDEARLAQVVANLVTNAAKYTEPGGHISVRARRSRGEVVIEVADDGVGIAPEILPRVFELFTQARQSPDRTRGGLGLGLAIVRSLVDLHRGRVTAVSEGPGKGSRFTVRLPALCERPSFVESPRPVLPLAVRRRRRLLLVDDNEDVLRPLAALLTEAGHEVRTAVDGPSALAVMDAYPAEVAILDIGLPVMDGYALAEHLRSRHGPSAPRLIALSGYGQAEDRARSEEAGFAQHLTKPIEAARLLEAIERAVL